MFYVFNTPKKQLALAPENFAVPKMKVGAWSVGEGKWFTGGVAKTLVHSW